MSDLKAKMQQIQYRLPG